MFISWYSLCACLFKYIFLVHQVNVTQYSRKGSGLDLKVFFLNCFFHFYRGVRNAEKTLKGGIKCMLLNWKL